MHLCLFESQYSRTSLNRTLLFQKVVRFSKILVYTRCRIAPANRTKFGLGRGFSDILNRSSQPSKGEPDLQGQRLKYLSVKRGKGNSENVSKDTLTVSLEFSLFPLPRFTERYFNR